MRKVLVAIMATALMLTLPAAAEAKSKKFEVTLKFSPKNPIVKTCEGKLTGNTLTLKGAVSPIRANKRVTILKKFVGGKWKVEGTARIRTTGRYSFADKPTTLQGRFYKVKMPALGSYSTSYSPYVYVRTFQDSCPD